MAAIPNSEANNGMPLGVAPSQMPVSRSAEFSSGTTGRMGVGGTTHVMAQIPASPYRPTSVLSPISGNPNGQSATTFSQNRVLDYYRD